MRKVPFYGFRRFPSCMASVTTVLCFYLFVGSLLGLGLALSHQDTTVLEGGVLSKQTVSAARTTTLEDQHQTQGMNSMTGSDWTKLIVADAILLVFAALFAGLTLSIMGLDTLSLEIIADSGSEPDKSYAANILPIRKLGNQLLCTLILGNVMVNTLIAQITDSHLHGWLATVLSTALITFGGEILPQALMSAHALRVGSKSTPLVRFFVILFYPISKPLSIFLNRVIGTDPGQIYERNELKKLMFVHAARSAESGIGAGEVDLMMGAMELHEKTVATVMTPIADVFMLEAHERLNEEMIQAISERGHSRIPVYQTSKNNIIGVLFAKDLLLMKPEENTKIIQLVQFYHRRCHVVPSDTKLIAMLKYFQTGRSHIALVQEVQVPAQGDPYYEIKGLVTLEDVIEEFIHSEILDEYDTDPDANRLHHMEASFPSGATGTMPRGVGMSDGGANKRHGLSSKNARRIYMNINELKACALFLQETLPGLTLPSTSDLGPTFTTALAQQASIYKVRAPKDARGLEHEDRANVWLYRRGVASNVFTLLVSGRVEVFVGKDGNSLELPSWSLIGSEALTKELMLPTFSARVVQDSTLLQLTREDYEALVRANEDQLLKIQQRQEAHASNGTAAGTTSAPSSSQLPSSQKNDTSFPSSQKTSVAHDI